MRPNTTTHNRLTVGDHKTHLDLFSGIGGFALAAAWAGYRTVGFCECDEYCQKILTARFGAVMADAASEGRRLRRTSKAVHESGKKQRFAGCGSLLLIHPDIQRLDGRLYRGIDLLTGGFPCQPVSQAGKQRGEKDDRWLWPEMVRVTNEARPRYVLAENVAGLITMGLDAVLSDLESIGYAARPVVIPACSVYAPHRRNRVWILAMADAEVESERAGLREEEEGGERRRRSGDCGVRETGQGECGETPQAGRIAERGLGGEDDGLSSGMEFVEGFGAMRQTWADGSWEEGVPRIATGQPNRIARLKALGNAIVPQVAYEIIKAIPS